MTKTNFAAVVSTKRLRPDLGRVRPDGGAWPSDFARGVVSAPERRTNGARSDAGAGRGQKVITSPQLIGAKSSAAERVHNAIEARTAQTAGHRDKGSTHRCPACGAPIIRALDDSICALTAVADPWPLDRAGELTALLTLRDTYALTLVPRLTLRRRDRWQIAGRPADTLHVVCDHRCGQPLGTPAPPADDRSTADGPAPF